MTAAIRAGGGYGRGRPRSAPRVVIDLRGCFAALVVSAVLWVLVGSTGLAAQGVPGDTLRSVAEHAWSSGDTERAMALYEAILSAAPGDDVALHRTALMHAWEARYGEALARFDRLIAAAPDHYDARVDRARVLAWSGDTRAGIEALDRVLVEVPDHTGALEARAQFEAWAGRYEASLDSYERLLAIAPHHADARRQRARVLTWASDFGASIAAYDEMLARDPDDAETRLSRARALALSGRLGEAIEEYERLLLLVPGHAGAAVGLGRTLGWAERLVAGERVLRRAVADDGGADAWLALGQNLSWQGRAAAALEAFERAVSADPTQVEAREQVRAGRAALRPVAAPFASIESDSDGNRMRTTGVAATWFATPRLRVRADAVGKALEQGPVRRDAFGVAVSGAYFVEPGWALSLGVGGSQVDGGPARIVTRAGVDTPARHSLRASLSAESAVLDETAALAGAGVRMNGVSVAANWRPAPRWRIDGGGGYASLEGTGSNARRDGHLSVRRTVGSLDVGLAARAFGFDRDLDDGYFDPDFYGIAEVPLSWRVRAGAWGLLLEAAPGVQRVTSEGDVTGATRGSLRVSYDVVPGREISLSAGRSTTGLQSFSTGTRGYHYEALVLSVGWRF